MYRDEYRIVLERRAAQPYLGIKMKRYVYPDRVFDLVGKLQEDALVSVDQNSDGEIL